MNQSSSTHNRSLLTPSAFASFFKADRLGFESPRSIRAITVIHILNQWGFIESRYPGKSLRSLHRLQLNVIDQVIERNQLDGALGALLSKLPESSTALH